MHDLNLRRRFGIRVVGVKNALTGRLEMFPDGEYQARGRPGAPSTKWY